LIRLLRDPKRNGGSVELAKKRERVIEGTGVVRREKKIRTYLDPTLDFSRTRAQRDAAPLTISPRLSFLPSDSILEHPLPPTSDLDNLDLDSVPLELEEVLHPSAKKQKKKDEGDR